MTTIVVYFAADLIKWLLVEQKRRIFWAGNVENMVHVEVSFVEKILSLAFLALAQKVEVILKFMGF
jgi:hypothetical protein